MHGATSSYGIFFLLTAVFTSTGRSLESSLGGLSRAPGVVLEASWKPLRSLLEHSGGVVELYWEPRGLLTMILEATGTLLGGSGELVEASWRGAGACWVRPGRPRWRPRGQGHANGKMRRELGAGGGRHFWASDEPGCRAPFGTWAPSGTPGAFLRWRNGLWICH